jgi:vancomycin resistance protein YoaR
VAPHGSHGARTSTTLPRHVHRSRRRLSKGAIAAIVPVALVAASTAAWGIDAATGGDVVRNVEVAGLDVGGDTRAELDAELTAYATELGASPVAIVTPNGTYETTAAALGLAVDVEATAADVLDAGQGFVLARPFSWMASFASGHEVEPTFTVDPAATTTELLALEGESRTLPTEPTFTIGDDGTVQLVAGVDGSGLDPTDVADALPAAALATLDGEAMAIEVAPEPIPPAMGDEQVQAVVDDANTRTSVPLQVLLDGTTTEVDPTTVRSWLRPVPGAEGTPPGLGVDQEAALASLRELLADVGAGSVDATFSVAEDGSVAIAPSQDGTGCCAEDTAQRILTTLQAGGATVELALGTAPPERTTEEAQALGITQPVGGARAWPESRTGEVGPGFTTFHAAGQSRVTNIHRIADLVRGMVIEPGGTFSVNERVGRRTAENGFVAAGAIRNGEHVDEIGGGVSQFATTLFNAAYFAGLDITTYQAHSEYFSRYPRGREATMGFPNPDLVIQNNTPYGVLVWSSYTSTSLTITLYSTPFASGEQTGIREGSSGNCAVVTTTRTRTFVDGRPPEDDTFSATYRPGEGQFC